MLISRVTVAGIVRSEGEFVVVEETSYGKSLKKQTAGHLGAYGTLAEAAGRELWEETSITAHPRDFIRMHQR
uniref:NUDIX domain-containing protein n=1 Tax=Salmonella enterica TaxID=28901 RepID=UPI00398C6892